MKRGEMASMARGSGAFYDEGGKFLDEVRGIKSDEWM